MKRKPKCRIHQNRYGNWNGYEGTRKTESFGMDHQAAKDWLFEKQNPRYDYGEKFHPVTGEEAPQDKMWCRKFFAPGEYFLESVFCPYTCSPTSETYWSS